MSHINVTIIILNWNRSQDTLNCLASIHEHGICEPTVLNAGQHAGDTLYTRLLIVDNGSTDNSVTIIARAYPKIQILALGENLGFGAGMNRGIQETLKKETEQEAEYVLLLNNDTLVSPKFLVRMLECMEANVGLVAPFIYYVEPEDELWSIGYNFNRLLWEVREVVPNHPLDSHEPIQCDGVTGCAMLIKRTVIEDIGAFDQRFFMYYEDLDFCLRVGERGYKTVVTPQAKIWHHVSKSSGGSHSPSERFHIALSSGRYFRKWMRPWQIPLIVPYRLFSALRWTLRLSQQGKWQALRAYWRGLYYGWFQTGQN